MYNFNGSVKIIGGEFRTYQELIDAALAARTYSADGDEDTAIKTRFRNAFNATVAAEVFTNPQGEIYTMDAFKGVRNGVTDQAAWDAGDFTAEPGGGEKVSQGKLNPGVFARFQLGNRVIYAEDDTVIYLDISIL
jgi:hypothetical protein